MERQAFVSSSLHLCYQRHLAPNIYVQLIREHSLSSRQLAKECQRLRDKLSMIAAYIPYPLIKSQSMYNEPGQGQGVFWEGSLLVAELRGLTAMAEQLWQLGQQGAEEAGVVLSQLFEELVEDIFSYGGGLLRLRGERLMVYFDQDILQQHAAYAAYTALALQARISALGPLLTSVGGFELDLRIGIHSGAFFAAELGDASHLELLLAGAQMEEALRALELAAPGEVVLTAAARSSIANATAAERQAGHYALQTLPILPPQHIPQYWGWETSAAAMADLDMLVTRLDVLYPCLPDGLPDHLLAPDNRLQRTCEFGPITALCVRIAPLDVGFEQTACELETITTTLHASYRRAQAIIHRYGGRIAQVSPETAGVTLIALFGAPDVHEDDPLRAVRAAIEVRQALHEAYAALTAQCDYEQETSEQAAASSLFAPRLGLSTGTAFVGAVGDKRRREFLVLGAVVQQALEAAAAADPNEILLTAETRRLVERHVVLHDTLPSDYTPDSKPFAVVECLAAPKQDAHFNVTACPPFIGREVELDKLLDSAAAARQAKGQVVALVGEAGSGKTRLIEEMHKRLLQPSGEEAKSFQVVRVECQRYEQHIPYAVARELLRQLLGLAPESSAATFAAAVSKRLQHGDSELVRFLPVLGNLLGYPVAETPLSNSLTAEQRHQRAYDLIEELVWIAARQQPLALVIDNVHWADASSFVLVDWLAQAASGLPLLLVLSYRPNTLSAEPWRSAGLILSLGDLWREQSTLLAASILGAMPSNTLMAVLEQAQGNPLFITELIWRLTQQGMLEKGSAGWELRTPPASVTLPARIEQVIAARLERLESVDRAVLQAAAVIGHRFSRSLLADVVADAALLSQRLENLQCNGFIRQAAFGYTFCNSLLRDIAYESILPEQRRDLHRRIAICLAKMHDNATDGQLELLARHSLLAEDWSSTFGYHLAAGRQARTRQATHEAITLFEAALATAPRLAAPPYDELLELHERLGYTRMLRGQYKKALEHFEQALTLCKHERSNATTETLMRLHRHIARIHERRADYAAAFEWLEQALALSSDTPNHESTCCLLLGAEIYQRQGKYNQSLVWAKCGLQMAETTENMRDQAYAYKLLANAHNDLGDIARAIDLAEKSLDFYTKVQDYQGQADLHNNLGVFLYTIGQWAKARLHYESAASLTAAIGDVYQQAVVANNLGDALRSLGDLDGAIVQYRLAQQGLQSSLYGSGVVALNLGAIYIRYGELDLAAKQFDHSFALLEQAEAEGPLSELFCYRAELALIQGDHAAALEHVQTALNYAVQLGTQLAEGISRRMFGRVFAAQVNLASAEKELQASIALLHEIGSRYELARSLLVFADLAPRFDQYKQGRAALAQAQETFNTLGAQLDLEHAQQVAARWGYQAAPYNNGKVVQPA